MSISSAKSWLMSVILVSISTEILICSLKSDPFGLCSLLLAAHPGLDMTLPSVGGETLSFVPYGSHVVGNHPPRAKQDMLKQ